MSHKKYIFALAPIFFGLFFLALAQTSYHLPNPLFLTLRNVSANREYDGRSPLVVYPNDALLFKWAKVNGAQAYWYSSDLTRNSQGSYEWRRLDTAQGIQDRRTYFELQMSASNIPEGLHWFQITACSLNASDCSRADDGPHPFLYVWIRIGGAGQPGLFGPKATTTPQTSTTTPYFQATTTPGSLSVSLDPSSPTFRNVAAGATSTVLSRIRFSASGEDIDLRQVALQLGGNPNALVNRRVTLWYGATQIGEAAFARGATATSSLIASGSFRIPKNDYRILTIKGDIACLGPACPLTQPGNLIAVDYDGDNRGPLGTYGTSVSSGTVIIPKGRDTQSGGVRIMEATATVSHIPLRNLGILSQGATSAKVLYRFSITTGRYDEDLSLSRFNFIVSPLATRQLPEISQYSLFSYLDMNFSQLDTSFSRNGLINGQCFGTSTSNIILVPFYRANDDCRMPVSYTVPAGSTRYFELRANVANVGVAAGVSVGLDNYGIGQFNIPVNIRTETLTERG